VWNEERKGKKGKIRSQMIAQGGRGKGIGPNGRVNNLIKGGKGGKG